MKTRKVLSFAAAAVMALASLPVLSAAAAENHIPGDVDMDGVLTGHDTAMVSRYIFEDGYSLTEEQLSIADVDGDGVVDQTDNEWMHTNEVYLMGNLFLEDGGVAASISAYCCLMYNTREHLGLSIDIVDEKDLVADVQQTTTEALQAKTFGFGYYGAEPFVLTPVQYNLMDCNADGVVAFTDAWDLLRASAYYSVGEEPYVGGDGCYMLGYGNN